MAVALFYMQMTSCCFVPSKVRRIFISYKMMFQLLMTWTELILVNVNVWDQLILELCTLGINPKNKFNASYISVWSSLVTYHSHNTYSLPTRRPERHLTYCIEDSTTMSTMVPCSNCIFHWSDLTLNTLVQCGIHTSKSMLLKGLNYKWQPSLGSVATRIFCRWLISLPQNSRSFMTYAFFHKTWFLQGRTLVNVLAGSSCSNSHLHIPMHINTHLYQILFMHGTCSQKLSLIYPFNILRLLLTFTYLKSTHYEHV